MTIRRNKNKLLIGLELTLDEIIVKERLKYKLETAESVLIWRLGCSTTQQEGLEANTMVYCIYVDVEHGYHKAVSSLSIPSISDMRTLVAEYVCTSLDDPRRLLTQIKNKREE